MRGGNKNILFAYAAILLFSSCARFYYHEADIEYENKNYPKAITYFEKGLEKKNDLSEKSKLANSYRTLNNTVKAEPLYKQLTDSGSTDPHDYFNYAEVLMNNENYDGARKAFLKYLSFKSTNTTALTLLAACDSVVKYKADSASYGLVNENIGDFKQKLGIVPYKNGIMFAATNSNFLDMYFLQKDSSGKWGTPQPLPGNVNGPYHEGPATFNANGNEMYFTRSNYKTRKLKSNEENTNTLKIFKATLVDGKWTNLEELPISSDKYSSGQPSLSEDGKSMYFVSDMPGGFGATDIYVSKLEGGKWSKPANLGSQINTSGKEFTPYIHADTLFFSSEGHAGLGGLDIFYSVKLDSSWSSPRNLKAPFNSSKDDFGFVLATKPGTGYFSSNRYSETDNLFSFTKRVKEKEKPKDVVVVPPPVILDSLAMKFLSLIKVNDSLEIPLVKNELMSNSSAEEKDSLINSEKQVTSNRSDNSEKKYAQTLSNLVHNKKTKANVDVMAKVETKKKVIAKATAEKAKKDAAKLAKENAVALANATKAKRDSTRKQKSVVAPSQHIGATQAVVKIKSDPKKLLAKSSAKSTKTAHTKSAIAAANVKKQKQSRRAIQTYTDDIKAEQAKLEKTIAELEQLYLAKSNDPKSLLNQAKDRNEIIANAFLTKEKSERQRYLMQLAKTIANNMNLKYEKGNPLTDLYDIIDAYDKQMLNKIQTPIQTN